MNVYNLKFTIEYSYHPEFEEPCTATIKVLLPGNNNNYLIPEIRNVNIIVCEEALHPCWGVARDGGREGTVEIYDRSWSRIKERAHKLRSDIIATIQSAYEQNAAMLREMPENESYAINLNKIAEDE